MQYYIHLNGQSIGPMTADQMMAYPVTSDTQVSKEGGAWAPLYTYPELMQKLHGKNAMGNSELSNKKLIAGILAIFLGYLGVQYFYLGKTTAGLLSILLSIVTCGLWSVVTLIQGILMLVMTDQQFEAKYVTTTSSFPLF